MEVGDLQVLLDPLKSKQLFLESGISITSLRRTYLRLKPGVSALVGFEITGKNDEGDTIVLPAYVRTFVGDNATVVLEKERRHCPSRTPFGEGVRVFPGGRSILFLFPNDGRLRQLRFVSNLSKAKRLLVDLPQIAKGCRIYGSKKSRIVPVKYKPERRYIAKAFLGHKNVESGEKRKFATFLRFYPDGRGSSIERFSRKLVSEGNADLVPQPHGSLLSGRIYAEELIEGEELHDVILRGGNPAQEIAEKISRFHTTPLSLERRMTSGAILEKARRDVSFLMRFSSFLEEEGCRILENLKRWCPEDDGMATLHGDLHLHQILVGQDGAKIVDLERMTQGDPRQDLGNLLAHTLVLAGRNPEERGKIEAFSSEFVSHYSRNQAGTSSDLAFHTAVGLVEMALLPFRRLEPDWEGKSEGILRLGRSLRERVAGVQIADNTQSQSVPAGLQVWGTEDRFEPLDRSGLKWDVLYPKKSPVWPARMIDSSGNLVFGVFDRDSFSLNPIQPKEDTLFEKHLSLLEKSTLVAYRPGKRAVLLSERQGVRRFTKILSPKKAHRLVSKVDQLSSLLASQRLPGGHSRQPLFPNLIRDSIDGALCFQEVPGVALHEILVSPDSSKEFIREGLTTTAQGLAVFHELESREEFFWETRCHPDFDFWLELIQEHYPGLGSRYSTVAAGLFSTPGATSTNRLLHGDLHDRNLLVKGRKLSIIDIDSLGVGPSEIDVGNLCAHLVLRSLQKSESYEGGRRWVDVFLNSYEDAGGNLDRRLLRQEFESTLFRLSCLYLFRRRWRFLTPSLLDALQQEWEI